MSGVMTVTEQEVFAFTYSAPEQAEVRKIREKYLPKEQTKLERLRELDEQTTSQGTAVSLVFGILSTLILGAGMSLCLVLGNDWFVTGILIGCVGFVGMAAAYPIYKRLVRKAREKAAQEILKLSGELLQ